MSQIAEKLAGIKEIIEDASKRDGRSVGDVCLIAVSKRQPDAKLEEALAAGLRVFGENKVQEALTHWQDRKGSYPDLQLHFIGSIQSKKIPDIVGLFDVIHTVDRPKLVPLLAAEMKKQQRSPTLLIQVNTGKEAQKSGVFVEELPALLAQAAEQGLAISGLMCLPTQGENPSVHFGLLRSLARQYNLPLLSMGMSHDYEMAVRFGATHIRIGTDIFGARVD